MIQIKHRFSGNVLYTAKSAQDVRAALEEGVKQRADLRGANLQGADLRGANLQGADLRGDINSPRHPLHAIRADVWSILDQAPGEVAALREAIAEGKINGSVYSDGECGCLCGTIGIIHAHSAGEVEVSAALLSLGIEKNGSRPAEQWVVVINKGDEPLPLDTAEWPSESVFRLSHLAAWCEEWTESRQRIAKALRRSALSRATSGRLTRCLAGSWR